MVQNIMQMIEWGVDWVLWLLFALGGICIAIFIERLYIFTRFGGNTANIKEKLVEFIKRNDLDGALSHFKTGRSFQEIILAEAINARNLVPEALQEMVESRGLEIREKLERGIDFLGTVGSNAPFIGLFGTVLGIIRAFHDLSMTTQTGPAVVMLGISEALVATATGLLVAIPSLWSYNYFKGRIKKIMRGSDVLVKIVLSQELDRSVREASMKGNGEDKKWDEDDEVKTPAGGDRITEVGKIKEEKPLKFKQ